MYFLEIKDDRITIGRSGDAFPYTVKSVADFRDYLTHEGNRIGVKPEAVLVCASSTLDFPEEFTSNPETIKLARALRGR